MTTKENPADRLLFIDADAAKTIELMRCRYHKGCRARNCKRPATMVARSYDTGGRPIRQYELCQQHADQIVERERAKGREIVTRS